MPISRDVDLACTFYMCMYMLEIQLAAGISLQDQDEEKVLRQVSIVT